MYHKMPKMPTTSILALLLSACVGALQLPGGVSRRSAAAAAALAFTYATPPSALLPQPSVHSFRRELQTPPSLSLWALARASMESSAQHTSCHTLHSFQSQPRPLSPFVATADSEVVTSHQTSNQLTNQLIMRGVLQTSKGDAARLSDARSATVAMRVVGRNSKGPLALKERFEIDGTFPREFSIVRSDFTREVPDFVWEGEDLYVKAEVFNGEGKLLGEGKSKAKVGLPTPGPRHQPYTPTLHTNARHQP